MSKRWLNWVGLVAVAALYLFASFPAVALISQTYSSTDDLVWGSIVSLDPRTSGSVVMTEPVNTDQMLGVVVKNALIESTATSNKKSYKITAAGVTSVLVSDLNGSIKEGDKITASPIKGVGMKATGAGKVIGTSQEAFVQGSGLKKVELTNRQGKKSTASITLLPVLVNVSLYQPGGDPNKAVPVFLQNISSAVAGKQVSVLRIIISTLIFLLAIASIVLMIYGAVKSSITSIGRNPLAQSAVGKGLSQVILMASLTLVVATVAVYLILSRG